MLVDLVQALGAIPENGRSRASLVLQLDLKEVVSKRASMEKYFHAGIAFMEKQLAFPNRGAPNFVC